MSGICFLATLDGGPVPEAHLDAMIAAAPYRGPDGVGRWRGTRRPVAGGGGGHGDGRDGGQKADRGAGAPDADTALAYQAFHVTPESTHERQPLVDEQHGLVLAADVRLDERDALIADLQAYLTPVRGGSSDPRTRPTDADLVLAAYKRWGDGCGAHLVGDYAFLVLDRRIGSVVAQRDPMGMRPLYYRVEPNCVLLASEVAQILAVPGVDAGLFEPAIAAHLLGQQGAPHWTAYDGVHLIPAGHTLTLPLTSTGASAQLRRFWDIDPEHRIHEASEEAYAERFGMLFRSATAARLRSVKPVGIQLSGGMDSGAIASMAGKLVNEGRVTAPGVHTYSWAFDELPEADERAVSDLIVEHYRMKASPVPADQLWPLAEYPKHAPHRDEPYAGVYQALLERAAEQAAGDGMGVLLAGSRGDLMVGTKVFDTAGALRAGQWEAVRADLQAYRERRNLPLLKAAWRLLLRPQLDALATTPWARPLARMGNGQVRTRNERARTPNGPARGMAGTTAAPTMAPWIRQDLLDRTRAALEAVEDVAPPAGLTGARAARYREIFRPLQMRNVLWDERLSARAGLAFADPWADRRLAEFVLAVPPWVVQRLSEPKRLARLALRYVIPPAALERTAKVSPAALYRRGVHDRARTTIERLLEDALADRHGFVDAAALQWHYDAVVAGEQRELPTLWPALTLEMWLRAHHTVDGGRSGTRSA